MSLKILLVEDHKMITDAYKNILSQHFKNGVKIITSNTLQSAYEFIFSEDNNEDIDIVVLDISMPPFIEKNINSGEDLAHLIRLKYPKIKIIFISGNHNPLILTRIAQCICPEGLIDKIDLDRNNLANIFNLIITGERYKSETIKKTIEDNVANKHFFDNIDIRILLLISQGIKTKNLKQYIPLTTSAIEKRKSKIKLQFGINNGNDEDLILEAKKRYII